MNTPTTTAADELDELTPAERLEILRYFDANEAGFLLNYEVTEVNRNPDTPTIVNVNIARFGSKLPPLPHIITSNAKGTTMQFNEQQY